MEKIVLHFIAAGSRIYMITCHKNHVMLVNVSPIISKQPFSGKISKNAFLLFSSCNRNLYIRKNAAEMIINIIICKLSIELFVEFQQRYVRL